MPCYNGRLSLKKKQWSWKCSMTLQHYKKCTIRSLWGHLPSFIHVFWLLWDQHQPTPLLLIRVLSPQEIFRAVSLSPGVCCYLMMVSCLLIPQCVLSQTHDTKPWESGSPTAVWHDHSSFVCHLSFTLQLSHCLHGLPSYTQPNNSAAVSEWVWKVHRGCTNRCSYICT